MRGAAILLAVLLPGAALALEVPLPPGATLQAEDSAARATRSFPEGPWAGGPPPRREARGTVTRQAWRVPGDAAADALMDAVRAALEAEGFGVLYACADRTCGGYDFRFALDLLPAPEMYVDLGNYRYLLAEMDTGNGPRVASVVTSRGPTSGYVHVTFLDPAPPEAAPAPMEEEREEDDTAADAAHDAVDTPDPEAQDFARRLTEQGHAVLEGLAFTTGAAALAGDDYPSLGALAGFLENNPRATVALVGHTDAVGSLDANIRLSRARAEAVRNRLVGVYAADGARIVAEGAGYLAPVASNLTETGRAANRRVEVVLLSGD